MSLEGVDLSGSFEDWTQGLPGYQRSLLSELRAHADDDANLAREWFDAAATPNNSPYGTKESLGIYATHFQNSMHDLLCSDKEEMVEQRKRIFADAGLEKVAIVSTVTAALSTTLLVAVPLLAAPVAVTLYFIGVVGKDAWCSMQTVRRTAAMNEPR